MSLESSITIGAAPSQITFTRILEKPESTKYVHLNPEVADPDTVDLYRTFPKVNGVYPGSMRVALKATSKRMVPSPAGGTVQVPLIVEISVSRPVGVSADEAGILLSTLWELLEVENTETAQLLRDRVLSGEI